jgi:uncharacterized protein (TIGR00299 family) protein
MVIIIDPQNAGISGNMMVGALIDLGVEKGEVQDVMEHYASYFGEIKIKINKTRKSGINATYAAIKCQDKQPIRYMKLLGTLNQIEHDLITPEILDFARKVFRILAEAESRVHGTGLDQVHFHEVGAADAVADIMGTAYSYHKLEIHTQKVYGMPPALGGGRKEISHGTISIPAPATLEILKGGPTMGGPVNQELTTPTGAALYKAMVQEYMTFYPLIINSKIGYGAGKMDLPFPNTLRILEGESLMGNDKVSILETNLDNVSGEILGHSFSNLLEAGALDVTIIPTITKKNRPGHLLRVITRPSDTLKVSEAIIRETGTLGVRVLPQVHRNIAERKIISIPLEINGEQHKIDIKVGLIGEEIISIAPEYEDAKEISQRTGISLKNVMKQANDEFRRVLDRQTLL